MMSAPLPAPVNYSPPKADANVVLRDETTPGWAMCPEEPGCHEWYRASMSGTYEVQVGNKGRIVLPAPLRERAGLTEGTVLVLIDSPDGIAVLTREQLKARVKVALSGPSLVNDLLDQRRAQAEAEDQASAPA
jgi:AbrB family looped-hinge helix DNA binding protein